MKLELSLIQMNDHICNTIDRTKVQLEQQINVYCRKGQEKIENTLVILESEGTTVDVAKVLPVTLSSNCPAYLQKSA